tara:strand:+ start:132 stop:254 length:123 start_codon:yes stop_codon:yes gene_type:complete
LAVAVAAGRVKEMDNLLVLELVDSDTLRVFQLVLEHMQSP